MLHGHETGVDEPAHVRVACGVPRDPEDSRTDAEMEEEQAAFVAWRAVVAANTPPTTPWRERPPSSKQKWFVKKNGLHPVAETRGAYSDAIDSFKRGAWS